MEYITPIVKKQQDCWPTSQQLLLAQAALESGQKALLAWEAWCKEADIEEIDGSSYQLLPLVYHNLKQLGCEHFYMPKLKGVYQRTWYANQTLFKTVSECCEELNALGIQTLIHKGAELACMYYPNLACRQMSDVDVYVSRKHILPAINYVVANGWQPYQFKSSIPYFSDKYFASRHAHCFTNNVGKSFDLHWHMIYDVCEDDIDADLTDGNVTFQFAGLTVQGLKPTSLLIQILIHGAKYEDSPPLRWIPDSLMILRHPIDKINWDEFTSLVIRHRLILPLLNGLKYLRKNFSDTNIPENVIETLESVKSTWQERLRYYCQTTNYEKLFVLIYMNIDECLRIEKNSSFLRKIIAIPKFFTEFYNIKNIWVLPFFSGWKVLKRVARSFQRIIYKV